MLEILIYTSTGIIIFSFICYFLIIIFGNKKVTDSDGFDITKDIISEYNSINVIESKNYLTVYNIKRKVIKLSTKCYYGNTISDISLALIEAGISVVDNNKNKYINLFRNMFSNLKILYIFPLITIFINNATYTLNDAKISLLFVGLFSFINYILYGIKNNACLWINDNISKIKEINKDNRDKIIKFINNILLFDKLILFGEMLMLFRFILILFEI